MSAAVICFPLLPCLRVCLREATHAIGDPLCKATGSLLRLLSWKQK